MAQNGTYTLAPGYAVGAPVAANSVGCFSNVGGCTLSVVAGNASLILQPGESGVLFIDPGGVSVQVQAFAVGTFDPSLQLPKLDFSIGTLA